MEEKTLAFEGGGILKLTETENGVAVLFQAPHFGEQLSVTSMSVVLTKEEAKEIYNWISSWLNK